MPKLGDASHTRLQTGTLKEEREREIKRAKFDTNLIFKAPQC